MTDKILIDRAVVEQALEALNASMPHNNDMDEDWPSHIAARRALRAALKQPQVNSPEIPEGWKLVPVEPADSQIRAAQDTWWYACNCETYWDQIYAAMIAAAPQPPVVEQPQVEQEPAPNGATHRQPKQGAFYKRVDGKWYVWSRMENGEPHRWYISPGTSESCLEPLNAAAPQPPAVKDSLTAEQPQSVTDCHQSQPQGEQEPVAYYVMNGAALFQLFRSKSQADALAYDLQKRSYALVVLEKQINTVCCIGITPSC